MKVKFYPSKDNTLWYSRLTVVTYATVRETFFDTEYFITEGEHTGKHILKSDCHQINILGRLAG